MDLSPGLQAAVASRRRWLILRQLRTARKTGLSRIVFQAGFGGMQKSGMLLKSDLSVSDGETF